jgi:acyl carrier protein
MTEVEKKLIAIFRASLSLEMNDTEIQSLTRSSCPAWDSMGHLNVLLASEDIFQIAIPEEKGVSIVSYWGMVEMVEGLKNGS